MDGDGRRVKSIISGETTLFVGAHYEVTNGVVTKYYFAGAQRIAMRKNGTLSYMLTDHLGSTSITTNASGAMTSQMRYKAWGEVRFASGTNPTKYTYTGQYSNMSDFGLMFYNARWYDPYLNHFTQPDTLVSDPYNPQAWNRYAYVLNNPIRYSDPSGHDADCGIGDSYCGEAKREYYYEWRKYSDNSSFRVFLRAKEAYEFYNKHPEVAVQDMFAETGQLDSWEDVDSYTLASIYSENVKHQAFNPVTDPFILWEIDRLNTIKESGGYVDPKYFLTLVANGVFLYGPDEGGGGNYGPSSLGRGLNTILELDDVSFVRWARASKPVDNPFSVDEAQAIWMRLEQAGLTPVLDQGHGYGVWTGPHINVRGTSIHIPVVPEFKP